ncbi:MAG: PEP-CTERM sorting domain-containing protein [Armatimonadota bacterium]
MRKGTLLLCLLVATSGGSWAAPVTVSAGPVDLVFYNNNDADGTNTGASNWTQQQMDDVVASVQSWDRRIQNTQGRQVKLHMFWGEFGNDSTLGGSYSPTNGNGTTGWTYAEHIWRDGVNYSAPFSSWDSYIQYDITAAGYSWNFGTGNPLSNQIDFRTVVTHELGHTLGFYDSYDSTPQYDDWGNTWGTSSDPYAWAGYNGLSMWDKGLVDSKGNRPTNGGTGTPKNFNQTDDPVYWDGSNAMAYYGGLVPIYAPGTYSAGSSLSHLDASLSWALMNPFTYLGDVNRAPSELEWAMMKDMGWNIASAPVPEPGSLIVLGCGVSGLIGIVLRRRRA